MAGKRMTIEESALYTVKDGKIVREEFFYNMGGQRRSARRNDEAGDHRVAP